MNWYLVLALVVAIGVCLIKLFNWFYDRRNAGYFEGTKTCNTIKAVKAVDGKDVEIFGKSAMSNDRVSGEVKKCG